MISQVTFWVRHGETTDPLVEFIDKADIGIDGATVIASDFIVDVLDPNAPKDVLLCLLCRYLPEGQGHHGEHLVP